MMRLKNETAWLLLLVVAGCGGPSASGDDIAAPAAANASPDPRPLTPDPSASAPEPRTLTPDPSTSDWPGFLGPTHDSKSPEKGILARWPAEGPRIVWHKKLGVSYGICSISKGRLFQFDRHRDKARLTCMKPDTGDELWQFEYPVRYEDLLGYDNGPRCCPVIDDDRVYIFGVEGMLHCVRVADGKEIWKVDTAKDFGVVQNFFGVGSTPLVEGDLLIVQIGGSPPDSPQEVYSGRVFGKDSGIVAFDKLTGKVKYKITDELASYSSPVAATINGRRLCFCLCRGGLVAFEPATGKFAFQYPWRSGLLESVNASNPVIVGDLVFISECYNIGGSLLRVTADGHQVVWSDGRKRDQAMATHWMTPIHVDGFLYGSSGRNTPDADLKCIELATGKVRWSEPRLTRCSLLYVDGHFVCLGEEGTLRLIKVNSEKYEEIAKVTLKDRGEPLLEYPAWAAPILSNGLLYVRGKDRLVCLDVRG
jgi:outer membrane protein assembly factor BamB